MNKRRRYEEGFCSLYIDIWFASQKQVLSEGRLCCDLQIHDEAKKFSYQTGVRVVVAYGGAPINQQVLYFLLFAWYFSLNLLCFAGIYPLFFLFELLVVGFSFICNVSFCCNIGVIN